jgi:hypothetical protein
MNTETSTLIGSDKQIAWATDIRDAHLARIDAVDTTCPAATDEPETVAALATYRTIIASITTASAFISYRADLSMMLSRIEAYTSLDEATRKSIRRASGVTKYGW